MKNKYECDADSKDALLANGIKFKDSKDRDYYVNGWKDLRH
jgi:hypothetical protein